ncbi:MAG: succinate--CoA ligase subunit beta [Candidatus Hodarchaeales archaeon]
MRLLEHESKNIFKEHGIPTPHSFVIRSLDEIEEKWGTIGEKVIIKAMIAIGGRGKAGLIKKADGLEDARTKASEILPRTVGEHGVKAILIEERAQIQHEIYCSITVDAARRKFIFIISLEGGIDIEEVAKKNPEAIKKHHVPIKGPDDDFFAEMVENMPFKIDVRNEIKIILKRLWDINLATEAQLVEINPLGVTDKGVMALDAKMILDDNASFRNKIITDFRAIKLSKLEKIAEKANFSFVELDGDIAIMANGAGLTLALLDQLSAEGIKPANFLDVGGGAGPDRVFKALELLKSMNPTAILVNIYGGITRCDDVAKGILEALEQFEEIPSLYIRLTGTKEKEGREILANRGISAVKTIQEAIERMKKGGN